MKRRLPRSLRNKVFNLSLLSCKLPKTAKRSLLRTSLCLLFLISLLRPFRSIPHGQLYAQLDSPISNQLSQHHHQIGPNLPPLPLEVRLPERHEVAPLTTRSTTVASSQFVNISVEAVLICHYTNPCCTTAIPAALRSIMKQTVIPSSLVLLHSCRLSSERHLLHHSAKSVLNGQGRSTASLSLDESKTDFYCSAHSQKHYDECLLDNLVRRSGTRRYRLLLSDQDVLEPTAVEKMWMYLEFHSTVASVRTLSFEEGSLFAAVEERDPMLVKQRIPEWNHTVVKEINAVPMLYKDDALARLVDARYSTTDVRVWNPLLKLLSKGRLLREALYTRVYSNDIRRDLTYRQSILSIQHATVPRREIPPQLRSELAFYKWSARHEEEERYNETFINMGHLDIARMATGEVEKPAVKRVMFVMPWLNMGGSEKAMLDLADRMLSMKWAVTFVLTMPNWHEDSLGEMTYTNAWLSKALSLTSDIINLVALAPNHLMSKAFRYVLESRKPDIILVSNTRWAYGHSALIRAVVPNAVVADYNHMIHMSWFGGGLPRYGANNSQYFDAHFTASEDVAGSMERWIGAPEMQRNLDKVKTCYIGTDPSLFYTGLERTAAKSSQRRRLNVPEDITVVLFAGRFVLAKGTDVMQDLIGKSASNVNLVGKLFFLFVGDGSERHKLEDLSRKHNNVLILPPAKNAIEMRNYYAMSDILLLPSVNEGIALVLYEAMASEVLVITTDVGGQHELVTPDSGILIPDSRMIADITNKVVDSLREVLTDGEKYDRMRHAALEKVRSKFTTSQFCECVIGGLESVERTRDGEPEAVTEETFTELEKKLLKEAKLERHDGLWKRGMAPRSLHKAITIGIKTYVCDEQTVAQVSSLVRSIRVNYPRVRVLLGNDGPTCLADRDFVKGDDYTEEVVLKRGSGISVGRNAMVNMTTTKYFLLLDDDHVFEDSTNVGRVVKALEKGGYDIVGMRIRNLPGIDELERLGINIPRYVARIERLVNRKLVLCIWNENKGPSVYSMEEAITVDVLHNAFVAKTDTLRLHGWRDELQVNEHMTFFLDAWKAGVKVGYLPSVFVHHRPRLYSQCYLHVRFREDMFRHLLEYEDRLLYDLQCGRNFPRIVRRHLAGRLFDHLGEDDDDDDDAGLDVDKHLGFR